jgi:hypothetical protein
MQFTASQPPADESGPNVLTYDSSTAESMLVTVTVEDTRARYLMSLNSQLLFVGVGFGLAELGMWLSDPVRKESRGRKPPRRRPNLIRRLRVRLRAIIPLGVQGEATEISCLPAMRPPAITRWYRPRAAQRRAMQPVTQRVRQLGQGIDREAEHLAIRRTVT